MSYVPFTTTCDFPGCGVRDEEYSRFPVCEGDGNEIHQDRHICPKHTARTLREWDLDCESIVECVECAGVAKRAALGEPLDCSDNADADIFGDYQ